MNISPDSAGGASVVFDLDSGVYSGHGVINDYQLPADVYLGFTGRTGGATNNHWVNGVSVAVTPVRVVAVTEFNLAGTGNLADGQTTTSSAMVENDILKITQLAGSQLGEAYVPIPGLLSTDGLIVRYQMYTGDGTGADGQCVNVGANTLGGRYGEDGVSEGVAICKQQKAAVSHCTCFR